MTCTTFRQITRSSIIHGIITMWTHCACGEVAPKSLSWSTLFNITSKIGWIYTSNEVLQFIHWPLAKHSWAYKSKFNIQNGISIRVLWGLMFEHRQLEPWKISFKLDVIITTGFVNQTISIFFSLFYLISEPFIEGWILRIYFRIKEVWRIWFLSKQYFVTHSKMRWWRAVWHCPFGYSMHAMPFSNIEPWKSSMF